MSEEAAFIRDPKLNIYQRLHAVMGEIDYIQKEKKQGMRYSIVSHDKVTAAVRPLLHKHGVLYHISDISVRQDGNRTEAAVQVSFVNIDASDDRLISKTFGYGVDDQDKGPGKAMSYAVKYALLKTLGLETGDEPHDTPEVDVDEVQDERANHKPEKYGTIYKDTKLIHPATPPGKTGDGPSAYSVKDTPLWSEVTKQSSLDDLDAWWCKEETQDSKAKMPWGHQVEIFERFIKRSYDVADSKGALRLFLDGYSSELNDLEGVDPKRFADLMAYAKDAKTKFSPVDGG